MSSDRSSVLLAACNALTDTGVNAAAEVIQRDYPFEPVAAVERKYGELEATRVFWRDGFIDRYSGTRLVFPGALRALSFHLPLAFPYQSNWKMSETHEAYWELSPTVDHVVPVTRGGADNESNWVTTSMRRNSAKSNWLLEDLGWSLHPPGDPAHWDGLLSWFISHVHAHDLLLANALVRRWYKAAIAVAARQRSLEQTGDFR